jgi:hypothetical protein
MKAMLMAAAMAGAIFTFTIPAQATLLWDWSYSGAGISAAGTFTTDNVADSLGFYQIIDISGSRDGTAITGLQATGTAIPGNAPYAVDNLVSLTGPQLTVNGFGFALADGDFANPFNDGTGYFEYLSSPPYVDGAGVELSVTFAASIIPEPDAISVMLVAALGVFATRRKWRG